MAGESATLVCGNPDCRVHETGKCVEGLELTACSHFGKPAPAADDDDDIAEARDSTSTVVLSLPMAERLPATAAAKILRRSDARVIAIVGPSDAGKTSLIAGIYDLFQEGPVAGLTFARSMTLHAFEQACHDARAASLRSVPHTERTRRGGVAFYHLDVACHEGRPSLALVIGDRAGEEYRAAPDDIGAVTEFAEISRADTITVLVDGAKLLDSGERHNVRHEIEMMLQALVDGEAIQGGQRLALVLTKLDEVQESPHAERAERDFRAVVGTLTRVFASLFSVIETFHVAASPKSVARVKRGHGVPALLSFWIKRATPLCPPSQRTTSSERAFARLTVDER